MKKKTKTISELAQERLESLKVASYILSELSLCPYNEVEDGELEMCKKCCTNNPNGSCWYAYLIKQGKKGNNE